MEKVEVLLENKIESIITLPKSGDDEDGLRSSNSTELPLLAKLCSSISIKNTILIYFKQKIKTATTKTCL